MTHDEPTTRSGNGLWQYERQLEMDLALAQRRLAAAEADGRRARRVFALIYIASFAALGLWVWTRW